MKGYAYTVDAIRAAEQPLLDAQEFPDQLMQAAAHEVFRVAQSMLGGAQSEVLLLVGAGGNGGDALYAGAELLSAGHRVEAWLVFGTAHSPALDSFVAAGGVVLESQPARVEGYQLAVDGIVGIGGRGSLPAELKDVCRALRGLPVLAVDVPSGVNADTGERGDVHITADATITFGGWRLAHALSSECGTQLLADIHVGGDSLSARLSGAQSAQVARASGPRLSWPDSITYLGEELAALPSLEPGAQDDKYSGGVVGIRAGSETYPGAAILCTAGAVAATPAMVRYTGPQALEVVRAHPEVVAAATLPRTGRVQAWVFGPGAGTDDAAADELAWLVQRAEPLLIDADGLSLITQRSNLRNALAARTHVTVLTPHDGEFTRLREASGVAQADRLSETLSLAQMLGVFVVRKGRASIVGAPKDGPSSIVDAGNSWAATPGSGDVLAGIIGALMARRSAKGPALGVEDLVQAVCVHARAAKLAATTEYGEAPTSASEIAAHVRPATAQLTRGLDWHGA
ncbi:bifunctional ADP-dependent NAD(P)H-hydrate dehydratase/NAD(P)H-hydrate epimerase [Corynebacterium capitovis]|uniref:bifunctional ADP-dependent NAD(P)H-hydrate dehydratase/NAD(P)H-hydrate epimerase n=1 Tax=Corynebacterium capitovis TaxID=131081 RepID=UPI00058BF768|nr:bifunctional ADP-dependent NAD(P)H-hydrate dehydratase/NAD(P)H-hydrate epimerase [Corynebacterium capitovis]